MFKKTKYALICIIIVMLSFVSLISCKSDPTPPYSPNDNSGSIQEPSQGNQEDMGNDTDHTHISGDAVIEDKIEATCIEKGSYYEVVYCTECNAVLRKEQITTDKLSSHSYTNGTCSMCGEKEKISEGLAYEEALGKYIVAGIGECTDSDIVIPELYNGKSVIGIKKNAFENNKQIKSVVIPDSITNIGEYAFGDCNELVSITMGKGVNNIGSCAFIDCEKLSGVYIKDLESWCQITFGPGCGNPLYNAKNLYLNGELVTELVVPDSITSIGDYQFYGCTSLTSVVIPNSVTYIGEDSFAFCREIKNVTIGNGVTAIDECAFYSCKEMTNVTIGANVMSIGSSAFYSCQSLTCVVIPDSVTSIGSYAFNDCTELTSVTIGKGVASIGSSAFGYCIKLIEVINKSSFDWRDISYGLTNYAKIVHSGDTLINTVDDYLFITLDETNYLLGYVGCDTDLVLPKSYNGENYEIYQFAFSNGRDITSVVIPSSVVYIGWRAFYECENLTAAAYTGTKEEWDAITVDNGNNYLTAATIIYNYSY